MRGRSPSHGLFLFQGRTVRRCGHHPTLSNTLTNTRHQSLLILPFYSVVPANFRLVGRAIRLFRSDRPHYSFHNQLSHTGH